MSFVLPSGVRDYFGFRDTRAFAETGLHETGPRNFLLFDAFYACLLLGLREARLGKDDLTEKSSFVLEYPKEFKGAREYVAGLIVEAELKRLDTEKYTERDFEREIAKLLDLNVPTRLSEDGIQRANLYAAGGYQLLRTKLQPKPTSVEDFLARYHALWNQD